TECWGNGNKAHPDTLASVRTRKWLYIEHYEGDDRTKVAKRDGRADVELYDLERDPFEMDNLLFVPEAEQKAKGQDKASLDTAVADLKARLGRLQNAR